MTAILIDDDDPDIRDLVVFTLEQASRVEAVLARMRA
jgi:hypothetical protein